MPICPLSRFFRRDGSSFCLEGEQPPSASGYARDFFAIQSRADYAKNQLSNRLCSAVGSPATGSPLQPPAPVNPSKSQYMWTLKWMSPESACKSAAELVTNQTLELLRYSAHFSGLFEPKPWKTALEATIHEKTLTVRDALFCRETEQL